MPSPYPILETIMKQGFIVEMSMGKDNYIYVNASNTYSEVYEASGKTISEAIINLSHRIQS